MEEEQQIALFKTDKKIATAYIEAKKRLIKNFEELSELVVLTNEDIPCFEGWIEYTAGLKGHQTTKNGSWTPTSISSGEMQEALGEITYQNIKFQDRIIDALQEKHQNLMHLPTFMGGCNVYSLTSGMAGP